MHTSAGISFLVGWSDPLAMTVACGRSQSSSTTCFSHKHIRWLIAVMIVDLKTVIRHTLQKIIHGTPYDRFCILDTSTMAKEKTPVRQGAAWEIFCRELSVKLSFGGDISHALYCVGTLATQSGRRKVTYGKWPRRRVNVQQPTIARDCSRPSGCWRFSQNWHISTLLAPRSNATQPNPMHTPFRNRESA